MTGPPLLLALGLAASLRVSIDRAYLPGEDPERAAAVHLAARGAREVEVSVYELRQPLRSLLGLRRAPARELDDPRAELAAGVAQIRESLRRPARSVAAAIEALPVPRALAWLAAPPRVRPPPGGRLVRAFRLAMNEPGWSYQDLALGPLGPGLYAVTASAGGAETATALLSVSRLALLAAGTADGASLLATDAEDGRPLAGVDLFAPPPGGSGAPVALGKTSPSGLWTTRAAPAGPIVGRWEGQLARVTFPDASPRAAGDRAAGAVLLDRSAYAPGDSVHVFCLLRERGVGAWKIPEAETARLQLVDGEGVVLRDQPAEITALGAVSGDVALPWRLPPGSYSLAVQWGAERRAAGFRVSASGPPELSARWQAPDWNPPAQPLAASVRLLDRLGRPLPGAAVHWDALERGPPAAADDDAEGPSRILQAGAGVTGADGSLPVRLPPGDEGTVVLRATAEDSAGRTASAQAVVPRIRVPVLLRIEPTLRLLRPGRAGQLAVEAQAIDGQPFRDPVRLTVVSVHGSAAGESVRSPLVDREIDLDARGRATVSLPAALAGYLEIAAGLPGLPALARASVFVTEAGGDIPTTPDRLELILDRREYSRGDELRALVLTPFESGSVLVGLEASGEPPGQVVAVRGYSGEARLAIPHGGAAPRVIATALAGGTLYRAIARIPLADRPAALSLRLVPEHPLRAGQRAGFTVVTADAAGHAVPADVALWASPERPPFPALGVLFSPDPPISAWIAASSGAADSALGARGEGTPRWLAPYGPSDPEGDAAAVEAGATSSPVELSADDSGRASTSLRVPPDARRLTVTALAVGGPGLFGERSAALPVEAQPRLEIDAPLWARAGDRFWIRVGSGGGIGAAPPLVAISGGQPGASAADGDAARALEVSTGGASELDISATSPAQKLSARAEVDVLQPAAAPVKRTAGELAAEVAEGLAIDGTSGDWPDLDCAAVRAEGSVREAERATAAAAALLARQNATGGFGAADGELRRDLAAWRGLTALSARGVWIDAAALARLRGRVGALAQQEADPERRRGVERILGKPPRRPGRRPRLPEGSLADPDAATAFELADWLEAHRPTATDAAALLRRLVALLPAADPLDTAECTAALAALPEGLPVATQPQGSAVSRKFLRLERPPWTQEMLDGDEEPAEAEVLPAGAAIPLGAEILVALSADIPGSARLACLRDFPPAGLAPIGLDIHLPRGLLLCGETRHGRLDVSWLGRAVRAGRFTAPGPAVSLAGGPGPASWIEIAR